MEKSIKWKKKKYLQICNILDTITEKANFCNIHTENNKISCNGIFKDKESLCCTRCTYSSKKGCTTISMACKMDFCYIGNGPKYSGLCNTKNKDIAAYRFKKIKTICIAFMQKYDIPYYNQRLSIEDTFACYIGKKNIDDFLLWEAIEATSENPKLHFYC